MYRRGTLTPRSEDVTPGDKEPEPELQSGQSPSGDTPPIGGTPKKVVYMLEEIPMITDMYESMSGSMLIRQAFNKGGGMSLWKGDVLSGVKSVIHDSMPALLTAEQRLAEGAEDELESLEEAKAALVDEAIEDIQARLKSHIEEMVVESTDKIFTTTIAPALNGMLSALVEPVPSDQIMTGEAAEEAEVQEVIKKSQMSVRDVEDEKYLRVMSALSAQAEHLRTATETKLSESDIHAAKTIALTAAHADQSEEGIAKVTKMRTEIKEWQERIDSLGLTIKTHQNNIKSILVEAYPIPESVQTERRLQDAVLKINECGDLINDPHPAKARKLMAAVWALCKDHPTQLWAIVPAVYRMMQDADILKPVEPINRNEAVQRLDPAMALYYQQHTAILYAKLHEANDAVATKACCPRKTGEDGYEPRVSEGIRQCGMSCISALRHLHEQDAYSIITNIRELIHSQWPLFQQEDNIKKLCGDMRKLVQQARTLRIEIHYQPTIYHITQILRQRSTALFTALERWLHFEEADKYDCIEKLEEFLTDVEHIDSQSDGPLTKISASVQGQATERARAIYSANINGSSTGGSSGPSDWTCCAKDCTGKIPAVTVDGYKQRVAKKPWGKNPDPAKSRLLCSQCYEKWSAGTQVQMKDGKHKQKDTSESGGGGGSGGKKSGKKGKGRAARAEGKKKKAETKHEKEKREFAEAAATAAITELLKAQTNVANRAAGVDAAPAPAPAPSPAPAPAPEPEPEASEGVPPAEGGTVAEHARLLAVKLLRDSMKSD